jgi:general secretion pathway protein M
MANPERAMSLSNTLNRSAQSFSEFWNARNARERRLLAAATVVVILGLLYALLIGPALSGRDQLNKSLPQQRQQVAQLQAMAKEAAGLSAKAAPSVPAMSRESIEAALARKGLKAQTVALTGDVARVQLSSASFAGLIGWLDDMQKTALLSVVEANIVAQAQPDTVNATLTLRQQKSE